MAEKKAAKPKEPALTPEQKYAKADRLVDSISCLNYDRHKADMYEEAAKIYKDLGELEDAASKAEECEKLAKHHREEAKKYEAGKKAEDKEKNEQATKQRENALLKRRTKVFAIIVVLAIAIVGAVFYFKSETGRYTRAFVSQSLGDYEKAYKMFRNLGDYKDSNERYEASRYSYADKCFEKGDYEEAYKKFKNIYYKNNLVRMCESGYLYAEECVENENFDEAISVYQDIYYYKDCSEKLAKVELSVISGIEPGVEGESVTFGAYRWRIAARDGNKVMLVKSEPIKAVAYNDEFVDVTWEDSSIRAYLNGQFLTDTFNEAEIAAICESEITPEDNDLYGTKAGNATTDKVFLLNASQANEYSENLSNFLTDWWLIGPGASNSLAQFVSGGEVMSYGYDVTNTNIRIRPAIWVEVE